MLRRNALTSKSDVDSKPNLHLPNNTVAGTPSRPELPPAFQLPTYQEPIQNLAENELYEHYNKYFENWREVINKALHETPKNSKEYIELSKMGRTISERQEHLQWLHKEAGSSKRIAEFLPAFEERMKRDPLLLEPALVGQKKEAFKSQANLFHGEWQRVVNDINNKNEYKLSPDQIANINSSEKKLGTLLKGPLGDKELKEIDETMKALDTPYLAAIKNKRPTEVLQSINNIDIKINKINGEIAAIKRKGKNPPTYKTDQIAALEATQLYLAGNKTLSDLTSTLQKHSNFDRHFIHSSYSEVKRLVGKACFMNNDQPPWLKEKKKISAPKDEVRESKYTKTK